MDKAKVMGFLRSIEWGIRLGDLDSCPSCWEVRSDGHHKNCRLSTLLSEGQKEKPERLQEVMVPKSEMAAGSSIKEFFIIANSFAAPFFSDTSEVFAVGATPELALLSFVKGYSHPCGLYSAALYTDANAYHRDKVPLARWLSCSAIFRGVSPGKVEIGGEILLIENPKEEITGRGTDCPPDRS